MLNHLPHWLRYRLVFLFMLAVSAGCGAGMPLSTPTATSELALTPYADPITKSKPTSTVSFVQKPTPPPTPTPTPVTYTIVEGDTMLAIALRNGIDLVDLQAANPEVNARLLVVGTELIIPLGEVIPAVPMTATPIPISTTDPECYPTQDGLWCFLLVTNERSRAMENISARFVVSSQSGEVIEDAVGISALNLVAVNESLPLTIFFPGNQPNKYAAMAEILSAQMVPKGDERYLNAWVEVNPLDLSSNRLHAFVSGTYGIPKKSAAGNLVWIVAVAYDIDGRVVGVRKIERLGQLDPGGETEFSLDVYSLGPEIAEVEVLIEARP